MATEMKFSVLFQAIDAMSEAAMAMKRSPAGMSAMTGLGGKAIDEIRESAIVF
jgi:hypothetical protein